MSKTIFVVEDDALTARQIKLYLTEIGYQFAGKANNAADALRQIKQARPDLVLMDIHLKGAMDGIDAAARLQADEAVAVIYLTAYADDETLERARLTEPFGYLLKPFTRQELKASIEMGLYKSEMEQKRQRILDGVVHTITELVKLHDPFLNNLQTRAADMAGPIAAELHFAGQEVKGIRLAALLHGVGLVGIPHAMFYPCAPLQDLEQTYFQAHPEISYQLLKNIDFSQPVAEMVHQHMERLDGSGFPRGLSAGAILPGARIVAVACRAAKLLTPQGIEPATGMEAARKELEAGRGTLFDADAVDAWVRLFYARNQG